MNEHTIRTKAAWEYDAYAFWLRQVGKPADRAERILADPKRELKWHAAYFDRFDGTRIANICGSCGKKAVPLAVLGAEVSVFDISSDNQRYALELAEAAGVQIDYQVCDVMEIDMARFGNAFDVVFMEGGILHYFHDIDAFMAVMHRLLKPGGRMICSDFHPFSKVVDTLDIQTPTMSYFSTEVYEGEMAHARFYDEETRASFPRCSYRKYTVSEIINGALAAGFTLKRFDEHPSWSDPKLPGEFTMICEKQV